MRLPAKLDREPLIDCIFELRLRSAIPFGDLVPGLLFSRLEGEKQLQRLPHSEIPASLRASNPEFRYIPISRIAWGGLFVMVGDYSLGVAAKIPYIGWEQFKPGILSVMNVLEQMSFVEAVERYGFKTTNLFEDDLGGIASVVKLELAVGNKDLRTSIFSMRSEKNDGDFISILQLASNASAANPETGETKQGSILDIDILWDAKNQSPGGFLKNAPEILDRLHLSNKSEFFGSITEAVLEKLGPSYG